MSPAVSERVQGILARLIAFDTTSHKTNLLLIGYIEDLLGVPDVTCRRIPDPVLEKASLWVTIGPTDRPGYVLSGHTDVVPAEGQVWSSDPFRMDLREGRLYGRGTADMKGFLAVCLAMVPEMRAAVLEVPIHLAISYDEEVGCTGVRPMLEILARQPVKPLGCFVGEPTGMGVVIGHKSKHAVRAMVRGKACHTALAPDGVNAVEWAAELILAVRGKAEALAREGARDGAYEIPYTTGLTSIVRGGTALNIVPDRCEVEFEFRGIAGEDPKVISSAIMAEARDRIEPAMRRIDPGSGIDFEETLYYPGLETTAEHPLVSVAKNFAGRNDHCKVAFGTEAGLFVEMASIPSVVIGPGSITQAHKPDEFIAMAELMSCAGFVERLIAHCCKM